MLFTPKNAQKVMDGTKTQTRRPVSDIDTARLDAFGKIFQVKTLPFELGTKSKLKWQVGKTYAVQPGRGNAAIGRIKLLSIRRERVNEISEEDAKAEGCEDFLYGGYEFNCHSVAPAIANFHRLWDSIYGAGNFDTGPMVWALEFEVL